MIKKPKLGPLPSRVCPFQFNPSVEGPERIVGLGFRYWMLGRTTGDIGAWERAWDLYSGTFGVACGRQALGQLSTWVGALSETACRRIEVGGQGCRNFCRDECVAISMIAACQHQTCPAMRACAFALIESSQIDGVVAHAQDFATTLAGLDHVLSPGAIVNAASALTVSRATQH